MKFGVWLHNCRHLATAEVIRATALLAERTGYDSIWVSDHVIVPHGYEQRFGTAVFDPLITLAVAAGATSRVQLGTTVLIVPYRHPVLTAKMVATLDALSGGRAVLGVGAGWVEAESTIVGAAFAQRGAIMDEYLAAMRELWTSPSPSFSGRTIQFSDLYCEPRPLQQPHPPIWVGGHGAPSLRRAVAFGDTWHPINLPVDELAAGRAQIARLFADRGRAQPPGLTLRNSVCLPRPGKGVPASVHGGNVIAGGTAEVVDRLGALAEVGVEHLVLEFLADDAVDFAEQIEAFARDVIPEV